jgi:hypothetical protein
MSVIDRGALRSGLRQWVSASSELSRLQDAMRVLFPGRTPSTTAIAEAVLLSAARRHERATREALGRMDASLVRLMDDVDALSQGRAVPGRTSTMRTEDLRTLERALADLSKLEDRVRHALASDETGSWRDQLRIELESALRGGPSGGGSAAGGALPRVARTGPTDVAGAFQDLRTAFDQLGAGSQGLWHGRNLPRAIGDAAHDLVVAAGGDVATAVRRALADGGTQADAMVIAILWREGHIAPGRPTGASTGAAVHQRRVSGLDFEWMGQSRPGTWNGRFDPNSVAGTVGIDHLANGLLVDAKHTGVPIEALPHLTQTPTQRTSWAERRDVQPEVDLAPGGSARSLGAEHRAWDEARHDYLMQMRRQLDFARSRGLRGIEWVCNTPELAEAFRLLSEQIPAGERANLRVEFRVGGAP